MKNILGIFFLLYACKITSGEALKVNPKSLTVSAAFLNRLSERPVLTKQILATLGLEYSKAPENESANILAIVNFLLKTNDITWDVIGIIIDLVADYKLVSADLRAQIIDILMEHVSLFEEERAYIPRAKKSTTFLDYQPDPMVEVRKAFATINNNQLLPPSTLVHLDMILDFDQTPGKIIGNPQATDITKLSKELLTNSFLKNEGVLQVINFVVENGSNRFPEVSKNLVNSLLLEACRQEKIDPYEADFLFSEIFGKKDKAASNLLTYVEQLCHEYLFAIDPNLPQQFMVILAGISFHEEMGNDDLKTYRSLDAFLHAALGTTNTASENPRPGFEPLKRRNAVANCGMTFDSHHSSIPNYQKPDQRDNKTSRALSAAITLLESQDFAVESIMQVVELIRGCQDKQNPKATQYVVNGICLRLMELFDISVQDAYSMFSDIVAGCEKAFEEFQGLCKYSIFYERPMDLENLMEILDLHLGKGLHLQITDADILDFPHHSAHPSSFEYFFNIILERDSPVVEYIF